MKRKSSSSKRHKLINLLPLELVVLIKNRRIASYLNLISNELTFGAQVYINKPIVLIADCIDSKPSRKKLSIFSLLLIRISSPSKIKP